MSVDKGKMRPLSRYLKDYKFSQTHCSQCGKELDRIALVMSGKIITKQAIAEMADVVDEVLWDKIRHELSALCRFCSEISCNTQSRHFDIVSFKQYLFQQTEMNHSTVREYVVRLRRLDEMLPENATICADNEPVHTHIADDFPEASHKNYLIALKKYDQYLQWQRTQP